MPINLERFRLFWFSEPELLPHSRNLAMQRLLALSKEQNAVLSNADPMSDLSKYWQTRPATR